MGYTAEDEALIKEKWDALLFSCTKICKNDEDWDFIKRAFFLAKEAHEGVRRRSGEPYLLHPIAVARIVADEIGLGVKSVVAALLHDVVEDTEYTVEDMERIFGPKIASMVDGLTKMSGVFNADTSEQAEYFRKVLLTLSDDVRVILIKIADRLHNMRTLGSMPMNKQIKITGETIYLFAPLAYRLGLYSIKSELEDLCMKYRFPQQYAEITQKLQESEASRKEFIDKFNAPIIEALDRDHFNYEISGRLKSVYSIWSKMQRKQIPFEEIYDLFAIRIVFKPLPFPSEKTQCWQIYSTITDIYTPKPDRLRDWISMPKANGYEALHSTVMGPDGVWVEVQIRTQRMEDIAERGFAAHWKYKHATISQDEDEFDKWLKQIRTALNSPTESAVDFLDNFKLSLYTSEIVVFTPKGESRKMPYGATALDFAYDIHSKIGNSAISAKINHKLEPITTQINNGDQIEIITADNARPKAEWLEAVTTGKAKQAIKSFLKRERQNNIERGMQLLGEKMKALNINLSGRVLQKIVPIYRCNNKEELYSKIGAGIISLDDLEKVLKINSKSKKLKFWTLFIPSKTEDEGDETDPNEPNPEPAAPEPQFKIAECCKPIPGDKVIGYRDPATGDIIVHKATCDELNRLASQYGKNIVKEEIKWSQHKADSYLVTTQLRGIDRMGLLLDLANVVSNDFNINIREVNIHSHDGIFEGDISLYVRDAESLSAVMDKLRKIKGIESVKRTIN
ncbi:MAG: bifunctional (p)ppGpp synthetase/guanosine-3',5'-bis(diphosphate) 3'-pyrophosphohydrolase [Alistipes sp.]|jgi:guanosine-3',5'-bis(diphosphate) 3'-pyrophosphohydrolase|uniref:RelA/SpoT family protein n=1 Tax=unclassified Alistipes TaxID=2608932 RepID=UPI00258ECC2A|nr:MULTISPECIES: RelA/SpoT family protein [unclassified Alistipes]MCI9243959.1 bifunctional (p)ppGpp synthetase/guanosine-3',5'-bis(diphosphate) 3'-pyrophosphohydrolase [Alistipes sp.]HUN13985.1 RelA/SpoT family protein [Alistipes sp.]